MINEKIAEILNRDLLVSTERGVFSSPSEITAHVNGLLDASYSTRAISVELQELNWQRCGSSRAKRKHDNKSAAYYWKENRQQKALLLPSTKTQSNSASSGSGESLSSINRRFRSAQADKERSLASTRSIETNTSKHRENHLRIQLEKERGELVRIEKVVKDWNEALVALKSALYTIPLKYSARWASETNENVIDEEFITELDNVLRKLCEAKEEAIKQENEKKFTTDTKSDIENEVGR